jgi:hypothetical protein
VVDIANVNTGTIKAKYPVTRTYRFQTAHQSIADHPAQTEYRI